MPQPPPVLSWGRPAWSLYLLGHLVPRMTREMMFHPAFLDMYVEYMESLARHRNVFIRGAMLARFTTWSYLLVRQCLLHPYVEQDDV